jgi:hypothetical protein
MDGQNAIRSVHRSIQPTVRCVKAFFGKRIEQNLHRIACHD